MDGVIIMLIATLTVSRFMYIALQSNIQRRHRYNSQRVYRNNNIY